MKEIPYVQILPFPYWSSLTNAQLEAVRQEIQPDGVKVMVVDYQELRLDQEPQLIEQDNFGGNPLPIQMAATALVR